MRRTLAPAATFEPAKPLAAARLAPKKAVGLAARGACERGAGTVRAKTMPAGRRPSPPGGLPHRRQPWHGRAAACAQQRVQAVARSARTRPG